MGSKSWNSLLGREQPAQDGAGFIKIPFLPWQEVPLLRKCISRIGLAYRLSPPLPFPFFGGIGCMCGSCSPPWPQTCCGMEENSNPPAGVTGMDHLFQFMGVGDGTQGFLCDMQSTNCHTHPSLSCFKDSSQCPSSKARLGLAGMKWAGAYGSQPCTRKVCTALRLQFQQSHYSAQFIFRSV